MSTTDTEKSPCVQVEPTEEHKWLNQLIGEWIYEADCLMGPGQPPIKTSGSEKVRSLDGIWTVGEGQGAKPDGSPATTIFTLGFNPETGRYVGTWIGSMMAHMWIYDGEMDAAKKVLTLNAEGPDFVTPGKTAHYQDIVEIVSPDHRVLRSQVKGEDGKWNHFMTAHYKRKA